MSDLSPRRSYGAPSAAPPVRSLVTGGSGFLGRHLVMALAQAGHAVCVLDPVTPEHLPDKVHHWAGSVTDPAVARRALEGIDYVFHLAGIAHLWAPGRDDLDRINRHGTVVMLAAAKAMAVRRFVHCSSYTFLLPARKIARPIDEAISVDPVDIAGPYSRSKYRAEEAARATVGTGQDVVIVNPTVLVGPDDRNLTPPAAMLAHFLSARIACYVDVVLNIAHVQDVAAGMILAAERGRAGERYILGGENLTLGELLDVLYRVSGRVRPRLRVPSVLAVVAGHAVEFIATYLTRRAPRVTAEGVRLALRSAPFDIGKARRELGYAPRPAEFAIADAIQWILEEANARTGDNAVAQEM
ncbi:MAG TPA: NAD-dependent epimerase/dehydratase family protein [Xanthobacteraceae bacterium]|jgi:dihydroflavonol-4-reductase|nr:NAD-dependent epimerase/dehydratase family protein [Xanthobacteraceae bacterium]